LWALPAYTLKGAQLASKSHRYRHELNGIFGKRFLAGVYEYRKSTCEERQEVLRLWKAKGLQSRVDERGELKDRECPWHDCDIVVPHKHWVDGDADINIHKFCQHSTV